MKKFTLLGIIIVAYFVAVPSLVFGCIETSAGLCVDSILSFKAFTANDLDNVEIVESQLFVQIIEPTNGGDIRFHFFNVGDNPAVITQILFAENSPLVFDYYPAALDVGDQNDGLGPQDKPNVLFEQVASNKLPTISEFPLPPLQTAFEAVSPPSQTGIDPGEYLDIILNYETGAGWDEFAAGLADGSLSLGLHVQAIGTSGNSEKLTLIACLPSGGDVPIPEPTTMLLLGTGLVGIAGSARRRKKMLK